MDEGKHWGVTIQLGGSAYAWCEGEGNRYLVKRCDTDIRLVTLGGVTLGTMDMT